MVDAVPVIAIVAVVAVVAAVAAVAVTVALLLLMLLLLSLLLLLLLLLLLYRWEDDFKRYAAACGWDSWQDVATNRAAWECHADGFMRFCKRELRGH